jgi:Ca2+:H+ antiporter
MIQRLAKWKKVARLGVAWTSVAAFLVFGDAWLAEGASNALSAALFVWIFVVMLWSSFGVIGEADILAEILGEPAGSLVLALSIIIIEAVLIGAAILSSDEGATKGRDTLLAANMIMINLTGAWRSCLEVCATKSRVTTSKAPRPI